MEDDPRREEALERLRDAAKAFSRRHTVHFLVFFTSAYAGALVCIRLVDKWLWPDGPPWYCDLGIVAAAVTCASIVAIPWKRRIDQRTKAQVERVESDFNLSRVESFLLLRSWSHREIKQHSWHRDEFDQFYKAVWPDLMEKEPDSPTRGEWQEK